MGVLSDVEIKRRNIITPCMDACSEGGVISYGLTSYAYDARLGYDLRLFRDNRWLPNGERMRDNVLSEKPMLVDPKNFNPVICDQITLSPEKNWFDMPPHSFLLGKTMETFDIPRDCLAICVGKSTYARTGIYLNTTPLEPEWRGEVTLEIGNMTPNPVRIYAGEGITAVYFMQAAFRECFLSGDPGIMRQDICDISYKDKNGKYMDQEGVTYAKVIPAEEKKFQGEKVPYLNFVLDEAEGIPDGVWETLQRLKDKEHR